MAKSLLEIAFEIQQGRSEPIQFNELWSLICEEAGLDEETAKAKVARFYTNLMLDGRFVNLGDNNWDLRNRHPFDKVHIDMDEVYSDLDSSDDDEEENEENEEYKRILEGDEPKESNSDSDEEESKEEEIY